MEPTPVNDTPAAIFPRVIDNTMYSDWRSCPHRFFRRHLQGLSKGRVSVHLHFGVAFAYALEIARTKFYDLGLDQSDAVKDGCEAFIDRWGNFEIPDGATQTERNKNLAAGLLAVQDYFREWPLDDPMVPGGIDIYRHNGAPAIEFSGAVPIPGSRHPETSEPIIYCGRFDMIGADGATVLGLDDKTTSSLGEHWRNQWRLRSQFTGYTWLAREYGIAIEGFRIRGTAILKTMTRFEWADIPRPPWMVDRWLAQLSADVETMCLQFKLLQYAQPSASPHPFGQNFDHSCSDFSGCEFLELCGSQYPDQWLGEYVVDRWNPLERPAR